MVEILSGLSALQLVANVVAALTVFFALDLWRRVTRAFQALGGGAAKVRRRFAVSLASWVAGALALTLVPPLRAWADARAWFQPVVTLAGITAVVAPTVLAGFRRAFDSLPMDDLLGRSIGARSSASRCSRSTPAMRCRRGSRCSRLSATLS